MNGVAVGGEASMSSILRAVGSEIGELGRVADRLQDTIGSLVEQAGCREIRTVEDLQALDLIVQRLSGLRDFLDALAPSLPDGWRADPADAARAVLLSDLARRLRGIAAPAALLEEDAGALDLFDA